MVLWICIGVVVLALAVLAVLIHDALGKYQRFDRALKLAQQQTEPAVDVVRTLAELPKPSLHIAAPRKVLVGPTGDVTAIEP